MHTKALVGLICVSLAVLAGCTTNKVTQLAGVCTAPAVACGDRCFRPSAGESCSNGIVCGPGASACGRSCFVPSLGQTCDRGFVCGAGQQVCVSGGRAVCYSPSKGESCN